MTIREKILELASEDYYGLWELVWAARPLVPEDYSDEQTRDAVQAHLSQLISSGLVTIFREAGGEMLTVPEKEALMIIKSPTLWREPSGAAVAYRVAVTSRAPAP